jgi:hypothetical protein
VTPDAKAWQAPPMQQPVPLIVVIDAHTEGHEGIAAQLGAGWEVTFVAGPDAAELAVAQAAVPLVLAPETLEPAPGRAVFARLAAARLRYVGVLLVDDAASLAPPEPDGAIGFTHLIFRPMRPGEFRLAVSAAAASRSALLAALAVEAPLLSAGRALIDRLAACSEGADGPSLQRLATRFSALLRPPERTRVPPTTLLAEALAAATPPALAPVLALDPPALRFATTPLQREPTLDGDARALHLALTELAARVMGQGAAHPEVAASVEPCRVDDRHGWLLTLEGPERAAVPGLELPVADLVLARHGGTCEATRHGDRLRLAVWLPSTSP